MKKIMLSVIAVMCLAGFSSLSFAEDVGKMKDEIRGEMKGKMKGDMKGGFKFQVQRVNDGAGAQRLPGAWRSSDMFSAAC